MIMKLKITNGNIEIKYKLRQKIVQCVTCMKFFPIFHSLFEHKNLQHTFFKQETQAQLQAQLTQNLKGDYIRDRLQWSFHPFSKQMVLDDSITIRMCPTHLKQLQDLISKIQLITFKFYI